MKISVLLDQYLELLLTRDQLSSKLWIIPFLELRIKVSRLVIDPLLIAKEPGKAIVH